MPIRCTDARESADVAGQRARQLQTMPVNQTQKMPVSELTGIDGYCKKRG
ncbi:hypothetical protein ALP48_101399 [Pseudomonas syringae pv. solidagae]|uniref:Uncharacterized protein n=1 Tax=Pseudomonas syringae pv. solidagae TaxID=264458 RepID=A0A3M5KNL2_PSESX|nr:hypothetical protein ALP49_101457 [Pseudomonas syringae pv. solidagae]RMT51744.1 hypothetical protein ALP48_101399 [Pseudomonas syringae pv. solidagae]